MSVPLIERARKHVERTAVIDEEGEFSYGELLEASRGVAENLTEDGDLDGERVAFMVPPGFEYPAVQWGVWRSGGVAVPLCLEYPFPELEYVVEDTEPDYVVATREYGGKSRKLADRYDVEHRYVDELTNGVETGHGGNEGNRDELPDVGIKRDAMILYTSGTTGKPKGVVSTHEVITSQVESLVEAWAWNGDDRILNTLPLHHLHGIINVMSCALYSGAVWETLERFDGSEVWNRFVEHPLTLYMGVPTMYYRLIEVFREADEGRQKQMRDGCDSFRLMVSGSDALPEETLRDWEEITGLRLLERYGMTEIGIALTNPLDGDRRAGTVGQPAPGVNLRIVNDDGEVVTDTGTSGEIQVRGNTVFDRYWRRPDETENSFTDDGWFRTGDVAVQEDGYFRILGRKSVDIINTGGYKVSAVEIEDELRKHPDVSDIAVVGVEDPKWGEVVSAAVVPGKAEPDFDEIEGWIEERVADYKKPRRWMVTEELPRNPLGKVRKPVVEKRFTRDG